MTQQALAEALDVSQATASKLLRGCQSPRPGLVSRIEGFLAEAEPEGSAGGLDAVVRAYKACGSFRRICHAALALMNDNE
jgi:transcriptional regulator with XRE-family HTH domain